MALFNLTRWPSGLVFLFAGFAAAIFAFVTVNLFAQAYASVEFIGEHRFEAIRHGALWQVLELLAWGTLALVSWLSFKLCEGILQDRYLLWARRRRERTPTVQSDEA